MHPYINSTPTLSVAARNRACVSRAGAWLLMALVVTAGASLQAAAPVISNVSPSRGPTSGGTTVSIAGSGFTGATQVTFGSNNATSFVVQSDTSILANAPAGAVGLVAVSVVTPEGTATLDEAFGYGTIAVGVPDTYNTPFNTTVSVSSPGVLSNDDPNGGGGWVAELGANVTNGTLSFSSDGGFVYTPNNNIVGTDSFTYRARNNTGLGNYAKVTINVTAPAGPQPPTALYASEIRGNRVTLRFTPPVIGPAATGFIIEGGPTPGSVAGFVNAPAVPVFSFEAPTGVFFLRVHTLVGADRSAASNEIQVFVNVPAVPSAPENLLSLVNGNALTLVWRNTFAGGEPTTVVLDVAGPVSASLPLGFTNTATFTGVPAGTYSLSLRELNAMGSSFPSAAVSVTVPDACSGAPLTPANFVAYKVGSTLNLVWEPAATGPAPTAYTVNVTGALAGSFTTTERGISGTVGAGSYTVSVVASNVCGASSATAARTVTIP
jgi:large repetitive protein